MRTLVFLSMLLSSFIWAKQHYIFIHGTLMPAVCLLTNPYAVYQQNICPDCCYLKTLTELRDNPLFYESAIMLEPGMVTVELTQLKAHLHLAAYQIAYVFNTLGVEPDAAYHMFGWSGELSVQARQKAGFDLYQALNKIKETDPAATFVLMGHSHGGNVISYLPLAEGQLHSNLRIDTVYLCATPIQPESAPLFLNPMFKNIYNLYSRKDAVQVGDTTVPSRCSYHKLASLIDLNAAQESDIHMIDIELKVHERHMFGHRSFFYFGTFVLPQFFSFFRQHHHALHLFDPLPLVAMVPMLQQLLPQLPVSCHHTVVNMHMRHNEWYLEAHCQHKRYKTASYAKQLQSIKEHLEATWRPVACANEIYKNCFAAGVAIKNRCRFW